MSLLIQCHLWKVGGEDQFVGRGGLRQVEPGGLESGGFPSTHGKTHMHQSAPVGIFKMIGGPLDPQTGKTSLKKLGHRRGWPKRRLWHMTRLPAVQAVAINCQSLSLTASVSKMIAAADCKGQKKLDKTPPVILWLTILSKFPTQ